MSIMEHDKRPWGEYFVLEEAPTHKVKRIEVLPGQRLSYQYHHKRAEVWTVISGRAKVVLNEVDYFLDPGMVIEIPKGARHRAENHGVEKLTFIEVQHGDYFGEDDIIRIEDDYNRS